ncbi:MAG: DUF2953 domain-containing protein [Eubacteriales bacterium]|nr:DUF2953 domain-containing protein [Eubacteriales bacterium]
MLAIILSILKIAGLLLLGILGLILLVLLLILLVPIRYQAEAERKEPETEEVEESSAGFADSLRARATVSWLLHILALRVSYDKELDICVKVFGIRLGKRDETSGTGKKKKSKDRKKPGKQDRPEAQEKPEAQVELEAQTKLEAQAEPGPQTKPSDEAGIQPESEAASDHTAKTSTRTSRNRTPLLEKLKSRLPHPIRKIRVTFQKICAKLKEIKLKKDQLLEFINKEENRQTFRLIRRQVIRLLKHILPRKLQGMVRFGFDDPYTTGQVLTYISPFYGFYARHLQLIPVFEGKALEGSVKLKGRIRIGTILVIGVRVLLDKNFRRILKQLRER